MVIFIFMPLTNCPTSVSSMFPRKIRLFILATVAIVVPSFIVLTWITEYPTFTGMSRIIPLIVERISVEEALAFAFEKPSLTTCKASSAASFSCLACWRAMRLLSYSSSLTSFCSCRFSIRLKSVSDCLRLISDRRTRISAELN